MPEATVIKFYSPVNESSIGALMKVIDQKLAAGVNQFTVLISTSGGSVFHGLTAYNYLKGIPAEVTTHNIGSVDSIGVALYCAGVVAANTRKKQSQVFRAMIARTALDPEAALEWGLVHEIRQQLFDAGAEVTPIQAGT